MYVYPLFATSPDTKCVKILNPPLTKCLSVFVLVHNMPYSGIRYIFYLPPIPNLSLLNI